METVTILNRRHSRRRWNPGFGSIEGIWNEGTRDMSLSTLAGGLAAGWAATGVPELVGWRSGYQGLLAATATVVGGTVLVGRYVSGRAAVGFGIVGGTIVINRLLKMLIGWGLPTISAALSGAGLGNIAGYLRGIGQDSPEFFGQDQPEIFGGDTFGYGALIPTYDGWGTPRGG